MKMPDPSSIQVLIVDDEATIADTLCLILNGKGYCARPAYSGEEAISAAKTLNPDILITDVIMEGISGIDAAIQISALSPSCRIIVFSGHFGMVELSKRVNGAGHPFEALTKPIHPVDLLNFLSASPITHKPSNSSAVPNCL